MEVRSHHPDGPVMTIEAELRLPTVTAQVVHFNFKKPNNHLLYRDYSYWLDMCLTPRPANARACYQDRWGPHRFEPLGDLFLVPPGEAFHARSDRGGDQASLICQIGVETFGEWLEEEIDWTDRRLAASLNIVNPHIRTALLRLAEEARHPGFRSAVLTEMVAGQVAIELARHCKAVTDDPATGGLAAWRLRLIDERLREINAPPSLVELAGICNISVRQLTRGFRTSRAYSIGDHIAQRRVENAKRLLGADESIKAIAFSLGFASHSSFSFAFRRATGITPRQFRQRQSPRFH